MFLPLKVVISEDSPQKMQAGSYFFSTIEPPST